MTPSLELPKSGRLCFSPQYPSMLPTARRDCAASGNLVAWWIVFIVWFVECGADPIDRTSLRQYLFEQNHQLLFDQHILIRCRHDNGHPRFDLTTLTSSPSRTTLLFS
jgi:hypothetical protein